MHSFYAFVYIEAILSAPVKTAIASTFESTLEIRACRLLDYTECFWKPV